MTLTATVNRLALVEALRICGAAAKPSQTLPILSHILITAKDGKLAFRTTDLELTVMDSCAAVVMAEGSVTVEHKRIASLVKSLTCDDVELRANGKDRLRVTGGGSDYELPADDADGFPAEPEFDSKSEIEIGATDFIAAMRTCSFAIDPKTPKELRTMGGAWIRANGTGSIFDATDGYRIIRTRAHSRGKMGEILIPHPGVRAVSDIAPTDDETAKISASAGHVRIAFKAATYLVRRYDPATGFCASVDSYFKDAEKPDLRWLIVSRAEAKAALERITDIIGNSTSASNPFRKVSVDYERGKVILSVRHSHESAREVLAADSEVEMLAALDARHVAQFLGAMDCDRIAIGVVDPKSCVLMRDAAALRDDAPDVEYYMASKERD